MATKKYTLYIKVESFSSSNLTPGTAELLAVLFLCFLAVFADIRRVAVFVFLSEIKKQ